MSTRSFEPALFDAHLHVESLSDVDLETLRFFGVRRAVVVAHHAVDERTAKALRRHFDELVEHQLGRLEAVGIRGYAAIGVDPRFLPRRGMAEVLDALPSYFGAGKVVAIGEIGLQRGDDAEVEAFVEQLVLARRLKLPVMVHTPARDKERLTRRILNLIRDAGLSPGQVLIDHVDGRTFGAVRACGHYLGVTVHPEALRPERASALVRKVGSERLILDSDAGDGPSDLTSLARTAFLMHQAGLSPSVIARACDTNAAAFFRIER